MIGYFTIFQVIKKNYVRQLTSPIEPVILVRRNSFINVVIALALLHLLVYGTPDTLNGNLPKDCLGVKVHVKI